MSYDNFIMEQSKTRYRSKYEEKGANEMDNKNERDEILELVEEMMKEFGLTETNLRNPINGQIEEADEIHKPTHYNWRGIECKDVIRQLLGSEGYKRYCEGNVIKYLYRYTKKRVHLQRTLQRRLSTYE